MQHSTVGNRLQQIDMDLLLRAFVCSAPSLRMMGLQVVSYNRSYKTLYSLALASEPILIILSGNVQYMYVRKHLMQYDYT